MTVLFRSVILVYITPCDGEEDFGARRLISHPYNSLGVSTASAEDEMAGSAASPDRVWLGRAQALSVGGWPWSSHQRS
jgi:hypothetical protein